MSKALKFEEVNTSNPMPMTLQLNHTPVIRSMRPSQQKNTQSAMSTEAPLLRSTSPKDERVANILTQIQDLTEIYQAKRNYFINERMVDLDRVLRKIYKRKLKANFEKIVHELAFQPLEALSRKKVRANYATMIKFAQLNYPKALSLCSSLLEKSILRNAIADIRFHTIGTKFEAKRQRIHLKGAFKKLAENAQAAKKERTSKKVTDFFVRLDTFLLLLEYNSFFHLRSYKK